MLMLIKFGVKAMSNYHDTYHRRDMLLLGYIFESFRTTCMTYYGLDPGHYFSSPGLSWDCMLN